MQREVFIRASVVSSELTWVHHSKIESFKVNFNFKRFKVNIWFLRKKVQSYCLTFKGSKLTFKGLKLTFKGSKLLTLREDRTYPRQFISIISLELVSTTVEVRTQWMWRFSTKTIVRALTRHLHVLIAIPLLSRSSDSISDKQDSEIQSIGSDLSLPWPTHGLCHNKKSKQVRGNRSTQPCGLCHDKKIKASKRQCIYSTLWAIPW